jgi:4-alpha-glucanotransferase
LESILGFNRSSGILLHPTSLPGRYGIGELGEEARRFVDFLNRCEQRLWQVMPLGPTGYGDSPYQCFSAFAGNTLLIDLAQLVEEKLLDDANLAHAPQFSADRVDFGRVIEFKTRCCAAHERFIHTTDTGLRGEFELCQQHASWLDDYALFRALRTNTAARHGAIGKHHSNIVNRMRLRARETYAIRLKRKILSISFLQTMVCAQGLLPRTQRECRRRYSNFRRV